MVNQYLCTFFFARNWQLPFMNHWTGMTVENVSWSISTKECCRTRQGSNPRPPVSWPGSENLPFPLFSYLCVCVCVCVCVCYYSQESFRLEFIDCVSLTLSFVKLSLYWLIKSCFLGIIMRHVTWWHYSSKYYLHLSILRKHDLSRCNLKTIYGFSYIVLRSCRAGQFTCTLPHFSWAGLFL